MTISTDRDKVRLLIGDTDETDPLLYDDEIAYHVEARTYAYSGGTVVNHPAAAADACEAIAAKFARDFTFAADNQSFNRAERVAHYTNLAAQLRRRQGGVSGIIPTGGTTFA